jgi:hypothetical protein
MSQRLIDQWAIDIPKNSGLAPCLYVPIAARDRTAIERHVGIIERVVVSGSRDQVLLIACHAPLARDTLLPIWDHENVGVLHCAKQVWTHVDYRHYRKAYKNALPETDVSGLVIDHVLNRRVARVKGFTYIGSWRLLEARIRAVGACARSGSSIITAATECEQSTRGRRRRSSMPT